MQAETLNYFLSFATIVGIFATLILAIYGYMTRSKSTWISSYISRYIFPLGFFITLGGAFLTLYYSEVLGYAPCDLCWYQRIFLYPQIVLFAYAWYKKDRHILPYSLLLSGVGFLIAGYHHLLQMGYDVYKPCSTAIFAVDCSKPSFVEFGFVTFPFMAIVLFGFLMTIVAISISKSK